MLRGRPGGGGGGERDCVSYERVYIISCKRDRQKDRH